MSKIREMAVELAKAKNYEEATYLLEKAVSEGDIDAINDLGVIYERNDNYEKAMELYRLSGLLGSPVAIHNVGNLFETGLGVDRNDECAYLLYKRAASMNYPHAFYKIASFYYEGKVVDKDERKAFEWVMKGAKLELKSKDETSCLTTVGNHYEFGIWVKKNINKALKYYRLASQRGDTIAKFNLALIYLYKKGSKKSVKSGMDLLAECSKEGYPDSFAELALLYKEGKLVKKDFEMVDYWLTKGLKAGSPRALLVYAEMFLSGDNPNGKKNIEEGTKALATFLKQFDGSVGGCSCRYNDIKTTFKDEIDWVDLENNPNKYLEKEAEGKCLA